MANLWHIDMGYDWAAINSFPIQWGVVLVTTVNGAQVGTPAYISDIQNGDTVMFYLYDVTAMNNGTPANPATQPTLTITQGGSITNWISSQAADSNTSAQPGWPIDAGSVNLITGGLCSLDKATQNFGSTVFPGGTYSTWAVQAPNFSTGQLTLFQPPARDHDAGVQRRSRDDREAVGVASWRRKESVNDRLSD